jgi:uncharacterized protein YfaS (alpha-2-macroglobulin family)
MFPRFAVRLCFPLFLVLVSVALLRSALVAEKEAAKQPKPTLTQMLGGADRYLTHVSSDKPLYRPGETVYIRGVVLHAVSRKPLADKQQAGAQIQITGPKGNIVATGYVRSENSTVGFAWKVPAEQVGGEYTAKITYPRHGFAPGERKFDVRSYRAPRLKNQIVFVRDGYGPGDTVAAVLRSERAEGGFPVGAKVTVQARVDGKDVYIGTTTINADGRCEARFPLPERIVRGEGTLAFIIEDGGILETAGKTIPILLQTVDLQMYPEGGDLIGGLPARVYFEARTPSKKPADIAGIVVDADGEQVAEFRSEHEGRGRFGFTPKADTRYSLKITQPAGIKTSFPLPNVKSVGGVIRATQDQFAAGEPVRLQIGRTSGGVAKVTLSRLDVEVASARLNLKPGQWREVAMKPEAGADGVLVATLWDADGKPLAERLVFRQPAEAIHVHLSFDQGSYMPGSPAKLTVRTTDSSGKPISAVVGLTVTDDSVLELIEKREQSPRLPVMVLLESDVRELADAHVYLDDANPDAPLAVDLLLGTQGWRRFAFVEPAKFLADNGDDARRVLALKMASRRDMELWARFAPGRGGAVRLAGAHQQDAKQANKAEPADKPKAVAAAPRARAIRANAKGDDDLRDGGQREAPQLRQALEADESRKRGLLEDNRFAKRLRRIMPTVIIREYAHQVRKERQPNDRVDFTETLYWNTGVKTDAKTGEATVAFGLSDAVTSFRVFADAFNGNGAIGTGTVVIESVEPFYVEPKLPLEVTSGDVIDVPLGIVNSTPEMLSATTILAQSKGMSIRQTAPFDLPGNARERQIVRIDTTGFIGETDFLLIATAGPYSDKVTRKLSVRPFGFPVEIAYGGMLAADETKTHEIVIPAQIVAGSLRAEVKVFPSPMANMTAALERLIREPNGCFEQTSSSTYPLVMAQQYFQSHVGIDPSLIQRSGAMLAKGYDRLIGYECKTGGFEWFGQDPGHEALTAYGLMEFSDMAQVRDVDSSMLARSRRWLLGRRDGSGGFKRERRALHTWLADPDVSNAYILWALLSAGERNLDAEIAALRKTAAESKNSYVLALAANVFALAGDKAATTKLLDRLLHLQDTVGYVDGATKSIVGSGGEALRIETTALATLAWLSDIEYIDFADKGIRYLAAVCQGGRYGSTQSTVLALKAIVAFDKAMAHPKAAGSLRLLVDGKSVGEPVAFDRKTQGAIVLPDMAQFLTPGKHIVAISMTDGSSMPHAISVTLNTAKPSSADECKVRLNVKLTDVDVAEGAVTEAQVTCRNLSDETIPTPIAIIGIPGGLEVRHDQLKELVKAEKIAAYEVRGREVVLYWREMTGKQKLAFPLSLVAAVPGSYTGPASRAYLYYTDEHKHWADPLHVNVTAKTER